MEKDRSHIYSQATIKRLYGRSGNRCAFPGCNIQFYSSDNDNNISNICHIEDARKNPIIPDRYNPNMTDKQRAHYDNLILLCPTHHAITNETAQYTVAALRDMKKRHEQYVQEHLAPQGDILQKNPAALNDVITYIGVNFFTNSLPKEPMTAPDPVKKIAYNNVIRYKPIIEEYKIYQGKLNKIYTEIEKQGSMKKELVLGNIKRIYLIEKQKYSNFDQVKLNADNIIGGIQDQLWNIIEDASNYDRNLPIEAIETSLLVIIVDAFMRCNILEDPNKK